MDSSGGNVGLLITQILGLAGNIQWGIRQSAELENNMTSVERVIEYQNVESEPAVESECDKKPSAEWPEKGHIKFENLSMRYHPDMQDNLVLKDLNIEIKPKEKIGIVGQLVSQSSMNFKNGSDYHEK